MTLVTASDGLPAREVRPWAEEKHFYIQRYMDIFTSGMKNIWTRRVYVDLFAGPGRCLITDNGREIDGSPMLALRLKTPFTHLYLNDLDSVAIDALKTRTTREASGATVHTRNLDCNEAAVDAIDVVGLDASRTLSLAVIDPTGFQIDFEALRRMTFGRRVDLIVTFMTSYLRRFIEQDLQLDSFFGTRDWRSLVDLRASGAALTFRHLLDFYEGRLRDIGYRHVNDKVSVTNSRGIPIYHLVFASKDERGADFFEKVSRRRFDGQQRMTI